MLFSFGSNQGATRKEPVRILVRQLYKSGRCATTKIYLNRAISPKNFGVFNSINHNTISHMHFCKSLCQFILQERCYSNLRLEAMRSLSCIRFLRAWHLLWPIVFQKQYTNVKFIVTVCKMWCKAKSLYSGPRWHYCLSSLYVKLKTGSPLSVSVTRLHALLGLPITEPEYSVPESELSQWVMNIYSLLSKYLCIISSTMSAGLELTNRSEIWNAFCVLLLLPPPR